MDILLVKIFENIFKIFNVMHKLLRVCCCTVCMIIKGLLPIRTTKSVFYVTSPTLNNFIAQSDPDSYLIFTNFFIDLFLSYILFNFFNQRTRLPFVSTQSLDLFLQPYDSSPFLLQVHQRLFSQLFLLSLHHRNNFLIIGNFLLQSLELLI